MRFLSSPGSPKRLQRGASLGAIDDEAGVPSPSDLVAHGFRAIIEIGGVYDEGR